MNLSFALLADLPEAVPTVAKWLLAEWDYESPGDSLAALSAEIAAQLDPATLPIHILALLDDSTVGVAILKPHEMKSIFPDRTPWLGSLVVAPPRRNRGIGAALVGRIEQLALSRGFRQIYLQTERPDGGLYARLGWQSCDTLFYRGHHANVMRKELVETS
jgi:GNAT superfamily N-acetyltransferase